MTVDADSLGEAWLAIAARILGSGAKGYGNRAVLAERSRALVS